MQCLLVPIVGVPKNIPKQQSNLGWQQDFVKQTFMMCFLIILFGISKIFTFLS